MQIKGYYVSLFCMVNGGVTLFHFPACFIRVRLKSKALLTSKLTQLHNCKEKKMSDLSIQKFYFTEMEERLANERPLPDIIQY